MVRKLLYAFDARFHNLSFFKLAPQPACIFFCGPRSFFFFFLQPACSLASHNETPPTVVCRYAPPLSCCSWVLRKPNVACPHPDISIGWPVMRSTPSWHSRRCQCVDLSSTEHFFFCICTSAKNVAIDFKCIENHGGTTRSELQVDLLPRLSRNLPRGYEKELLNGVYSSLFRGKASGGTLKSAGNPRCAVPAESH